MTLTTCMQWKSTLKVKRNSKTTLFMQMQLCLFYFFEGYIYFDKIWHKGRLVKSLEYPLYYFHPVVGMEYFPTITGKSEKIKRRPNILRRFLIMVHWWTSVVISVP